MSRRLGILFGVISTLALILSSLNLFMTIDKDSNASCEVQYVLYLGLNDKDSHEPVMTRSEAKDVLEDILLQRFGGYTIQEASGGWVDVDGAVFREDSLAIYLSEVSEAETHALAQRLMEVFHQRTILIQANRTHTEFYSGQ